MMMITFTVIYQFVVKSTV